MKTDVLVIGGGVIGVASAYYLSQRGRGVTLVEQGEIASGSSYGNAGLIVPSHSTPLPEPGALAAGLKWMLDPESPFYIKPRLSLELARWLLAFSAHCTEAFARQALPTLRDLGLASAALFGDLADLFDFGYQHKGLLQLYKTEAGFAAGRHESALLAGAGLPARPVTIAEARAIEPLARTDLAGGIYYETDAHLNPAEFVRGLAGWLETHAGVTIHRNTRVTGLVRSGRRLQSVRTTQGEFEPAEVVLATGAWSPEVARQLGLRTPIQAAKGYSVTIKRPASYPSLGLLLGETRVAVTPMASPAGDLLRFAGTLELAGMDRSINPRRVAAVKRAPGQFLEGLEPEGWDVLETWSGLRPCTPDGLPIIGRSAAFDNLVLAAGHAMVGVSLGPITGKLVSQILMGEAPAVDLRPLRAERF
jgi:D-amino-acid dehydrogenase